MYSLWQKNTPTRNISISYNNTPISNTINTTFLGLIITDSLSWKDHTAQLIPKLSKACYVLRCIRPFMSLEALKSVYYSYFHSLLSYGIMFWGNSSYSLHIFRLQKKAIRIIMGLRTRDSCKNHLNSWGFSHYSLNTYFHFWCLWWKIKACSK